MWKLDKKLKYKENILKFFNDPSYTDVLANFTLMVKSGEVYQSDSLTTDDNGFTIGEKSRSRAIMNPNKNGFGMM